MKEISAKLVEALDNLQERIGLLRRTEAKNSRIIVALAGSPGSGKSTIAAALLERFYQLGIEDVAVVPMDGFHHPKSTLGAFSDPANAFLRRGAPFTYDAEAFVAAVKYLRASKVTADHDAALDILWPSFDRATQDPVSDDIVIPSTTKVVILEGNYVLLNQSPWNQIASLVQDRWFVEIPRQVVKRRLAKRHLVAGLESTDEAAERRVEANDLINGDLVAANLIEPDLLIHC